MSRPSKGLLRLLPLALVAVAMAIPAGASGASLTAIYHDYSADGTIEPCKYSAGDLQGALSSVPTDVQQYDPRFVDKLNRSLEARSSGQCGQSGGGAPAASGGGGSGLPGGSAPSEGSSAAPDGSPKPAEAPLTATPVPAAQAPADLDPDRGFPTALVILAAVIALVLLACGGLVLARRNGWDPPAAYERFADRMRELGSDIRARLAP